MRNELTDAFFSLKLNKSPGYDEISFNVVKKYFSELCKSLKYLFNSSIKNGVIPDKLKISHVSPVCKTSDSGDLTNSRPISVPPCFSKFIERIVYNRLYSYVSKEKNTLKTLWFSIWPSAEYAILQLANQIHESFEHSLYNVIVFVEFSKTFNTANHFIIFKKLEISGIHGKNLECSNSYLRNRM